MNRDTNLPKDDPKINKIRRDILLMFEQSVGYRFRIVGSHLIDEVVGVDKENQQVIGKQYGSFHVDLCQLTNEPSTQTAN